MSESDELHNIVMGFFRRGTMTTRAQIIKQCHDILMDVIGLIEVKTDSDAGALAVNTLVELAMEGENKI